MKTYSDTVSRVLNDIGDLPLTGEKGKYKYLEIIDNEQARNGFNSLRSDYIDKLVCNLDDRFPADEHQTQ
ncbi:hypothetical protein DPMN_070027 [Dreissena polymorpha]|uniref:Uncharacterized protein n=1 Tax=Dreissena polymorpha TaxID=45954 RepID=A0A9D3Z023_DREPO|nr:hypothetical protein DPMN_070027 [Dreissena polymorpha]